MDLFCLHKKTSSHGCPAQSLDMLRRDVCFIVGLILSLLICSFELLWAQGLSLLKLKGQSCQVEFSAGPNDNRNRRTARGFTLIYENCGFNSHTIDKCFKIIGYPADFGKRKAGSNFKGKNVSNNDVGSNSSIGFSNEQMTTLISLIKENSINEKGIHANTYMNSSTMCNKNFEKFFCFNSSMHSKLVSKGLITNSGANQHITYTDKNLTNVIDVSYLKIKVTHPNGNEAFFTKIRNMPLTNYLTLYDVLVVPEYCVSLMSIHKVFRDSKLVITFDEMHCYVMNQDLREGKILGTDKQIDRLYYFNGNQGIEFKIFKSNNVCFLSKQTWHCKLGHPADQVLDVLNQLCRKLEGGGGE
ncbi:hypothetical protein Tco_0745480 [Tanacetum coccineum]